MSIYGYSEVVMKQIESYFNNPNNMYYGHGTGRLGGDVVESIFSKGLRCSHGQLYWTTCSFGFGSDTLFAENKDMMDHWKHLDSKQIVVVSLPDDYIIRSANLDNSCEEAFYYQQSNLSPEDEGELLESDPEAVEKSMSSFVMPEFIRGYYDANNGTFTDNPSYYENLPPQQQVMLFAKLKANYLAKLKDVCETAIRNEIYFSGKFDGNNCNYCKDILGFEADVRKNGRSNYSCPITMEESAEIDKSMIALGQEVLAEIQAERQQRVDEAQVEDTVDDSDWMNW